LWPAKFFKNGGYVKALMSRMNNVASGRCLVTGKALRCAWTRLPRPSTVKRFREISSL
jgi:hypothetical protein